MEYLKHAYQFLITNAEFVFFLSGTVFFVLRSVKEAKHLSLEATRPFKRTYRFVQSKFENTEPVQQENKIKF